MLTDRESLEFLMNRVRVANPVLADLIKQSIDAGKLVSERSELRVASSSIKKQNAEHVYERRIPLTHKEAIEKVLLVLRAYLVELPLCISSATSELSSAEVALEDSAADYTTPPLFRQISDRANSLNIEPIKVEEVVIYLAHEGTLENNPAVEPIRLNSFSSKVLEEQQVNLKALAELLRGAQ